MSAIAASGLAWSATYNGDGARLRQTVNGAVITYTQDLAAPLPVVLQAKTNTTTTRYLFATGTRPLAEYDIAWEYLLPDGLGSVRQIADANGYVRLTAAYEPYGSLLSRQGSATSVFGFTGEQTDVTGLVFLRARYMQPALGVFLSRDPWSGNALRPLTYNGWAYVGGNPTNYVDPFGLCPDGDPECEALGKLAPIITENARRLNQRIFTNMTDSGLAAMVGAKLLYEGELPGGSQKSKGLEKLPEIIGRCDMLDLFYRLLKSGRPSIYQGASFGIANVYFDQASSSAWWWRELVQHQGQYGLSLQENGVRTRYYEVWELEDQWYRQQPFPGMHPAPSPWSSRQTLIDELLTNEGAIQFQALEILHQGWKIYEGAPAEWGANRGTPTAQISAFRIAMGVLADATNPENWRQGSEGLGHSDRWVGLMPRAASCLKISVVPGLDYLPLSAGDRRRFAELGHNSPLP